MLINIRQFISFILTWISKPCKSCTAVSALLILLLTFIPYRYYAQDKIRSPNSLSTSPFLLKGNIKNYAGKPLYLYQCYKDTLLLKDSTLTDEKGYFAFSAIILPPGMYKVKLQRNQYFYILHSNPAVKIFYGMPVEVQTLYDPHFFYNVAADSLIILSGEENQRFCHFQHLQLQLNVAREWLLQMMRLYPLRDHFHTQIEKEYFKRYDKMEQFVKEQMRNHPNSIATRIAMAYYILVIPNWKEPDPDRNKVFAQHYFDFFDPADTLFLYTNILPDKIMNWYSLHYNKRKSKNQNEQAYINAVDTLFSKVRQSPRIFEFVLNLTIKGMNKLHYETVLVHINDIYVEKRCENYMVSDEMKEKMKNIKKTAIGQPAPPINFENLECLFDYSNDLHDTTSTKKIKKLRDIKASYTLVLFWTSWCPHCTRLLPEIKQFYTQCNSQTTKENGDLNLEILAISLDTNRKDWTKTVFEVFVKDINPSEETIITLPNIWLNYTELKGWYSTTARDYNIYATPTMFLLDSNKKIISKPKNIKEIQNYLMISDQ